MAHSGQDDAGRDTSVPNERAVEAERLLDRDADAACTLAADVLATQPRVDDASASTCHRVLATAALRTGDMETAGLQIETAVRLAERSSSTVTLGKALMTTMAVAASTGDPSRALELADRAEPLLPGELRVRLAIQRGSVLVAGFAKVDEAIAVFDRVLTDFPEIQGLELGMLRLNRGTQLLRRGDLADAAEDFRHAASAFHAVGNDRHQTAALLHLAMAAARMGDLPTVFEIHRQLTDLDAVSRSDPHDVLDLAECLVIAGLLTEASDLVDRAVQLGRESGVSELTVQIELLAARVHRLLENPTGRQAAERARVSAEQVGSEALQALAAIEVAMSGADSERPNDEVINLRRAADVLRALGHRHQARDAEIEALSREVTAPGAAPTAERLPAMEAGLTPFDRAQLRHLRALLLCADDDPARARRELLAGIRDIESARAAIAASDLRAAAGDRAPRMAALGLRLAIEAGRPRPVLEWAERVRATALRLAGPPLPSSELRDELDELRRLEEAEPNSAASFERRIANRLRADRVTGHVVRASSATEICQRLGTDRVLLEYLDVEGQLMVCVVARRRVHVVDLGITTHDVEQLTAKLLFGLRRMASRTGPSAAAAGAMVDQLARHLAERILPARWRHANEFVVVPTGPLHHLPWAILRPLDATPFVIAPSAHVWCTVADRTGTGKGLVVGTGQGLVEAEAEARDVAACWTEPTRQLLGVSSSDLRTHLPGSMVAHLCCHGRFRSDSPQFSALDLDDGPFTVFDLESIPDLPPLVVLSACSLGSVDVRLGDDVLGFPAALFARGVSTLIASVLPVEDAAIRAVMTQLHAGLAGGASPAVALRDARVAVRDDGLAQAAAASTVLCFGRG